METDKLGNQALLFAVDHLPPFGTRIVRIKAVVGFAPKVPPTAVLGPEDAERFLRPDRLIEADDSRICELAVNLRSEGDPLETSRRAFDWVVRHVRKSGYSAQEKGARAALEAGQGDCSEMALLFVALCRSAEIPARYVSGWVVKKNSILNPHGFHNWAEFHVAGAWRVADCSTGEFAENETTFLAVRIGTREASRKFRGFYRFELQGAGLKASMNRD
ncbi:MAG: transglutaminase domain-containing protein [Lentisphaeria bacterium]|nr:transglutaminase domain-containing protein [Lentisphaeria bacterium]